MCCFFLLQACTLLLVVLFVYDVFFVFITPLLTKVRECVMLLPDLLLVSNGVDRSLFTYAMAWMFFRVGRASW